MSSIASIVSRGLLRTIIPVRGIFTASGVGMDQFMRIKEMTAVRLGSAQSTIRKRLLEDVQKDDRQIFSEDLKNLLYIAENDDEINAVLLGLRKYYKNGSGYSNFHFGAPVMRLLSHFNQTEKAVEVFTDQSTEAAFKDSASCLILMNHLIEQRRFEDAIKIFNIAHKRGFVTASGKSIPSDVLMLLTEALFCTNTKESFVQLEKILKEAQQSGCNFTLRTIGLASLHAIKQGRPDVALEITTYGRNQNSPLFRNIKAICFADLGRVEEAIQTVRLITEGESTPGVSMRYEKHIYPLVMKHIRTSVEKNDKDNSIKEKLEELVKDIYNSKLMTNNDIEQFLLSPMNRTYNPNPQQSNYQTNLYDQQSNYRSNQQSNGYYNQQAMYNQQYNQPQQYRSMAFNQQPQDQFMSQQPSQQFSQRNQSNQERFNAPQQFGGPFIRPNAGAFAPRTYQNQFQRQAPNQNTFQGRAPLRSPLSGGSPSTIRSFSNPTSNRPGPDDENQ